MNAIALPDSTGCTRIEWNDNAVDPMRGLVAYLKRIGRDDLAALAMLLNDIDICIKQPWFTEHMAQSLNDHHL